MSLSIEYLSQRLAEAQAFDEKTTLAEIKEREPERRSIYPMLSGALGYQHKRALELAEQLFTQLVAAQRRLDAVEWAAESILNSEDVSTHGGLDVSEWLMSAADAVEATIASGVTDGELRELTAEGIDDDEITLGRLIRPEERCEGCGEFCGEEVLCKACQEENDED